MDQSSELLAAQDRLTQLRQELAARRVAAGLSDPGPPPPPPPPNLSSKQERPAASPVPPVVDLVGLADPVPPVGSSLSWSMRNAIADLQRMRGDARPAASPVVDLVGLADPVPPVVDLVGLADPVPPVVDLVKVWPSLGIAARGSDGPELRLWTLCKWLDTAGAGWVDLVEHREEIERRMGLTWRRIRQIIAAGDGAWWVANSDGRLTRLWLSSPAKAAGRLGLANVGRPVSLPVAVLASQGEFNAAIFAAWHTGRNNPISQRVVENLTNIPERTQRHYCRVANVERRSNYATGERHTPQAAQENAWRHGGNSFTFIDRRGKQGREGAVYTAHRLPNAYATRLHFARRGRLRKINKEAIDLVTNGARGNGSGRVVRIFHDNGSEAARAANRQPGTEQFWPVAEMRGSGSIWRAVQC